MSNLFHFLGYTITIQNLLKVIIEK